MKKLILTASLLVAISGGLLAQTKPGQGNGNVNPGTNKNCPAFVDKNNNNICDTFEANGGQCMRRGQGQCPGGPMMGQGQRGQGRGNGVRARDGSGPQCPYRAVVTKV